MKQFYPILFTLATASFLPASFHAQCSSTAGLGSSSNLFTHIRNSTNPVAADKLLNTVVFIHRNNVGSFGGNSGQLRYDVSYNAGSTWTTNIGVVNPINSNYGRYPNVAIYNPTNNLVPSNAYMGYLAATINSATSAWNGVVSGVSQLNSASSTENYNQPVTSPQFIPHSVVKGAPGVFWAIDALFNGANITGFTIYRGQWNSTTNDIVWVNNYAVTPTFNTGLSTIPQVGDYNIAFDPTGTVGWFSFLGHVSPGPANYALYPVFYKTTNGGVSWTGPFQVNLNNFSCMTSNTVTGSVLTTNFEHDLVVDVNGNPHMLTTICNGSNAYGVFYNQWHHMFDITQSSGLWVAYDLANVSAGRGTWGTSPNQFSQDMAPQAARSADGTKLFFTWTDNSTYTAGQANLSPNLFGKAYNVSTNTWTQVKDFTACNVSVAGSIIVPHVAPEVLEPSTNVFKLAPVYGIMTSSDPLLTANFNFLDNVTFSTSEFTVNPPPTPTLSVVQGTNVLLCPGSTISINLGSSVGQALWSTGSTANFISVSSPTISTYSVVAQQNCNVGTATISVTNMSMTPFAPAIGLCDGAQTSLSVTGNAISYSWSPVNLTGTSITVTASTATPVYTVSGISNANCALTQTVGLTVFSLPTVSITGSSSVCANALVTLTASGASTYSWSNGSTSNTISVGPVPSVMCMGTDNNGCENTDTFFLTTLPVPTVTAISDKSVVCVGGAIALTALGATTYSWSNGASGANTAVTPSGTTIYSVTGFDNNGCSDDFTISLGTHPLPNVVISSTRPNLCLGEKAVISVSGAVSYMWNTGITSTSLLITPVVTTNYTITGIDANSCVKSATFAQVVLPCTGLTDETSTQKWLQIYPNPSDGVVTIKTEQAATVVIYDELGRLCARLATNTENTLELTPGLLQPGVYFVGAVNLSGKWQKLVISK